MRDAVGVVFPVEGDGCMGPSEPRWCGEGVGDVHLLLSDVALLARFIGLGVPEDQEATPGLWELIVFLLGASR